MTLNTVSLYLIVSKSYLTTSTLNSLIIICTWLYCLTRTNIIICIYVISIILTYTNPIPFLIFGLQNSLAWIHPIILLLVYSSLLQLFFALKSWRFSLYCHKLITILFFTLILGGWWAFQEFNWGGWWNWDGIETPVFVVSLYITIILWHKYSFKSSSVIIILQKYIWCLYSIIILIILPRFGQINSIHSFINIDDVYICYYSIYMFLNLKYVVFTCLLLKSISFWTFFFFKALMNITILRFSYETLWRLGWAHNSTYHQYIYIVILAGLTLNFKNLSVCTAFMNCDVSIDLCYRFYFGTQYMYWLKPNNLIMISEWQSLRHFLN